MARPAAIGSMPSPSTDLGLPQTDQIRTELVAAGHDNQPEP
jgi:hypothetical protein